jgi:hypothetical protein
MGDDFTLSDDELKAYIHRWLQDEGVDRISRKSQTVYRGIADGQMEVKLRILIKKLKSIGAPYGFFRDTRKVTMLDAIHDCDDKSLNVTKNITRKALIKVINGTYSEAERGPYRPSTQEVEEAEPEIITSSIEPPKPEPGESKNFEMDEEAKAERDVPYDKQLSWEEMENPLGIKK